MIPQSKVEDELRRIESEQAQLTKRQKESALKDRLERKHGVMGHPKADLLFARAWEYGHAHSETEMFYDELVELIK